MLAGAYVGSCTVASNNSGNSNYIEKEDTDSYQLASMCTNTGSGSVTVNGTACADNHVFWAVPIIASAGGSTPSTKAPYHQLPVLGAG